MKTLKWTGCMIMALLMLSVIGCSGGGSGGGSDSGTLSLSLTDATTDAFQAIYVTIKEVQVYKAEAETEEEVVEEGAEPAAEENGDENENGWETISTPEKTYNLLALVNCMMISLLDEELEAGHYTQMRMILGEEPEGEGINILGDDHPYANYLIDGNDAPHELKVPSGFQTGIKIVHGFDIIADQTTDLILDFDASKSVVKAGNSGKWLLKPTIKVVDGDESGTVIGSVELIDDIEDNGNGGVRVSAQKVDDPGETGTITENDGSYCLTLEPGDYTLIAEKDDYVPVPADFVIDIIVEAGNSYEGNDFVLELQATQSSGG